MVPQQHGLRLVLLRLARWGAAAEQFGVAVASAIRCHAGSNPDADAGARRDHPRSAAITRRNAGRLTSSPTRTWGVSKEWGIMPRWPTARSGWRVVERDVLARISHTG